MINFILESLAFQNRLLDKDLDKKTSLVHVVTIVLYVWYIFIFSVSFSGATSKNLNDYGIREGQKQPPEVSVKTRCQRRVYVHFMRLHKSFNDLFRAHSMNRIRHFINVGNFFQHRELNTLRFKFLPKSFW